MLTPIILFGVGGGGGGGGGGVRAEELVGGPGDFSALRAQDRLSPALLIAYRFGRCLCSACAGVALVPDSVESDVVDIGVANVL